MKQVNYRHRITLERAEKLDDGAGGRLRIWQVLQAQVPAEVTAIGGREQIDAGALTGNQSFRIIIRYTNAIDLSVDDRVVWDDHSGVRQVMNIRSVTQPDGMNRQIHLICDTGLTG